MQRLQLHQIKTDAKSGVINAVELFYSKNDGVRLFVNYKPGFTYNLGCLVTQRNEVRHFKSLDSAYKVAHDIAVLLPSESGTTAIDVSIKGDCNE